MATKKSVWPARKIGDVVRLNSGGPEMTVADFDESDGDTRCYWFKDDGESDTAIFPSACLTAVVQKQ